MKILSASQIREADQYTIKNEPISSSDLMERAAATLAEYIEYHYGAGTAVHIFCGMGNNGGDGLALARMLREKEFTVFLYIVKHSGTGSDDFQNNLLRLQKSGITPEWIEEAERVPELSDGLMVDALLGSGLNRPLKGLIAEVVKQLNKLPLQKLSVDIPTGLFADSNAENDLSKVFKADVTLTFQCPKLSFFHRKTAPYAGDFQIMDIGLHPDFLEKASTRHHYFTVQDASGIFKPRSKFSYKGTYGHALLIAGGEGKGGAAILSGKAAMRAGAGLVSIHTVKPGIAPVQTAFPEAMVSVDEHEKYISVLPDIRKYAAIGMGPGTGTGESTARVLKQLIQTSGVPLVLDADALNILSENKTWLSFLPPGTILTPHIGEFRRLIDEDKLQDDYLEKLRDFSLRNRVITVLKDSITTIADTHGNEFFVNSGSPALATAGSGDVLTGVITGLLSGGYSPIEAALLGTWLQGRAGTIAGEYRSLESIMAGDIIEELSGAFRELY